MRCLFRKVELTPRVARGIRARKYRDAIRAARGRKLKCEAAGNIRGAEAAQRKINELTTEMNATIYGIGT